MTYRDRAIELFNSKAWCDADNESIRGLEAHVPLLEQALQSAYEQGKAERVVWPTFDELFAACAEERNEKDCTCDDDWQGCFYNGTDEEKYQDGFRDGARWLRSFISKESSTK